MLNYTALFIAVCLSTVAGIISVLGLITIFAANVIWVAIVGGTLEVAKVVAATWLHHHWKQTSIWIKSYLSVAIVILMLITSMGIYGFFSKAHIDQQVTHSQNSSVQRADVIEQKIVSLNASIQMIDSQLTPLSIQIKQLSDITSGKIAEKGQTRTERADVATARKELVSLRSEQSELVRRKESALAESNALRVEKVGLMAAKSKLEAEVGPIKYVAALFFSETGTEQLERAVRWMILLLVFVFDPLAIIMIVAASSNLQARPITKPVNVIPEIKLSKLHVVGGKDVRKLARRKRKKYRRLKATIKSDEPPKKRGRPVLDLTNAKL